MAPNKHVVLHNVYCHANECSAIANQIRRGIHVKDNERQANVLAMDMRNQIRNFKVVNQIERGGKR